MDAAFYWATEYDRTNEAARRFIMEEFLSAWNSSSIIEDKDNNKSQDLEEISDLDFMEILMV